MEFICVESHFSWFHEPCSVFHVQILIHIPKSRCEKVQSTFDSHMGNGWFFTFEMAIYFTKICTTVFVLTLIVVLFILWCRQPNIQLQHIFSPQLLCWSQDRTHPLFLIPCPQCYRERRGSHLQQGLRPHCWFWLSGQQACIWAWAFSQSERKLAAVQELLMGFFVYISAWVCLTGIDLEVCIWTRIHCELLLMLHYCIYSLKEN